MYCQLGAAASEVHTFFAEFLLRLSASEPWEIFGSTLPSMLHDYMKTCELATELTWHDQVQLLAAILHRD